MSPERDMEIAILANQFVIRGERVNPRTARNLNFLGVLEDQDEEQAFYQHYKEIAISLGRAGLLLEFEDDTDVLF
jgi:hypothetical protein